MGRWGGMSCAGRRPRFGVARVLLVTAWGDEGRDEGASLLDFLATDVNRWGRASECCPGAVLRTRLRGAGVRVFAYLGKCGCAGGVGGVQARCLHHLGGRAGVCLLLWRVQARCLHHLGGRAGVCLLLWGVQARCLHHLGWAGGSVFASLGSASKMLAPPWEIRRGGL
jgi:hypothetical protein